MKKMIKLLSIVSALVFGLGVYTTVQAADYTVVETNMILYSNADAVLYSDADLLSNVVLPADVFPDAIPIVVTGITSNGFFRVDLGETYYVAGYGLQEDIPDITDATISSESQNEKNIKNQANTKQNTEKTKTNTKQDIVKTNTDNSRNVWLPATGDKYHSKNNCGRMNPQKARKVTEQEAINFGYGKCKKCW